MNILGISGSPRRSGYTDILLEKALEGAKAGSGVIRKLILNDLSFKPCQECGGCDVTGACVVKDDLGLVYKSMKWADAVIIASPIFFGSLSAQTKTMIDRYHCAWVAKYVLRKKRPGIKRRRGIFLCVAGKESRRFFDNAKEIVRIFFVTLDIDYVGDLFLSGLNEEAPASPKIARCRKKAFQLGRFLAEYHKKSRTSYH